MKKKLYAFAIGVAVGLRRYSEKKLGIKKPRYNACTCVNFITMQADPNCNECWGTGVRPDKAYAKHGVLLTYHKYKSPLRHLKIHMTEADREVYRRACEVQGRFLDKVILAGPSYRENLPGWQEPYEPETYDPTNWDA